MFDQVYELPMSAGYVESWGVTEAVREIAQNCLDSESPFEWKINKREDGLFNLTMSSRHSELSPRHLVLGNSSKSGNNNQIGQFGEGFKLALLVLCREGLDVTLVNGGLLWTPEFKHSNKFESTILKIKESKNKNTPNGLHYLVCGLDQDQIDAIYQSNLYMRDSYGEVKKTSYGEILLGEPAKVFVNGLFVCDTELQFGYNFKPEYLKLNRDRKNVESFDLAYYSAKMWLETGEFDFIAKKVSESSKDMVGIQWSDEEMVKDACYRKFVAANGEGKIVVSSQAELEKLAKDGITNTVVIYNDVYRGQIMGSKEYLNSPQVIIKSPNELMSEFFEKRRGEMRTKAIVGFKSLLRKSKEWKLK